MSLPTARPPLQTQFFPPNSPVNTISSLVDSPRTTVDSLVPSRASTAPLLEAPTPKSTSARAGSSTSQSSSYPTLKKSISLTSLSKSMKRRISSTGAATSVTPPPPLVLASPTTDAMVAAASLQELVKTVEAALSSTERLRTMLASQSRDHKATARALVRSQTVAGLCLALLASVLTQLAAGVWVASLAVLVAGMAGVGAWMAAREAPQWPDAEGEVMAVRKALQDGVDKAEGLGDTPGAAALQLLDDANDEDKEAARLAGMAFNCFAGLDNIDFRRDVLAKLDEAHRTAFAQMDAKFEARIPGLGPLEPKQIPDMFTRLRFLQADHYRVDDSVARLCKTTTWRRDYLDRFIAQPNWTLIMRCRGLRPRVWCGYDKHGRPLMVERLGHFFGSDEAFKGMIFDHWIKGYAYEICELTQMFREYSKKTGIYQHQIAYLGDLSGLKVMSALRMLPFLKNLVSEVESHFPELAGRVVLINAGSAVPRLFGVVKRFLDPNTANKISVLNGSGRKELLEAFGADVLPEDYGGMNPIKVPFCPEVVDDLFNARVPVVSGVVL